MHYFLFYPALNASFNDSTELLAKFMCLGENIVVAMEKGIEKTKRVEEDELEAPLLHLVTGFNVRRIEQKFNAVVEKVIARFGQGLEPSQPSEKGKRSMIALLLVQDRWDIIEQVIDTTPLAMLRP